LEPGGVSYDIDDPAAAGEFVGELARDLQDETCPPKVRALKTWLAQADRRLARRSRHEELHRGDEQPPLADQAGSASASAASPITVCGSSRRHR
jgi:hypothetical protein